MELMSVFSHYHCLLRLAHSSFMMPVFSYHPVPFYNATAVLFVYFYFNLFCVEIRGYFRTFFYASWVFSKLISKLVIFKAYFYLVVSWVVMQLGPWLGWAGDKKWVSNYPINTAH